MYVHGSCLFLSMLCAAVVIDSVLSLGLLKYVVCLCKGCDGCCVFCLYCRAVGTRVWEV